MSTAIAKNFQIGADGTATNNFTIFQPASPDGTLRIGNGNTGITTGLVTLTSAGNLGLGVTPSAWFSNFFAIQCGTYGNSVYGWKNSYGSIVVGTNHFVNSSGNPIYTQSQQATKYVQELGVHSWHTAPSGTAGNAISFTQAMTLDASGNLLVGTTSAGYSASGRGLIEINGSSSALLALRTGNTNRGYLYTQGTDMIAWAETGNFTVGTAASAFIQFQTNNTERARIDSSGNLLVGTTSSSSKLQVSTSVNQNAIDVRASNASFTSTGVQVLIDRNTTNNSFYAFTYYNVNAGNYRFIVADSGNVTNTNNSYGAISDIKLKENITDATPKLEKLQQVRVVNYNFVGNEQKQLGVIAQELEQIFPGMVEESPDRDAEGNELGTTTKSVKYSVFVPMLIKAIQELNAKVEAQAAEIAALKGQA